MLNSIGKVLIALALAGLYAVAPQAAPTPGEEESDHYKGLREMSPAAQLEFLRGLHRQGDRSAALHYRMGNAFYSLEESDSAIAWLVRATEIDSTYSKAWVNLGIAYDGARQSRAAREAYNRAIAVNPEDVLAYCHLGFSHFERGEVDQAVKLYTRALEIDPNSAQARYNLGLAFADAKLFSEALIEWNRVVELDPDGELGKIAGENVELIQAYLEVDD